MNLMDLFIKIGVDDQATGPIGKITGAVGKGLASAAKVGLAAVSAASAGIVALAKASIDQFAEYQQLVGGVETLYGASYQSAEEYAKGTGASLEMANQVFGQYSKRQQTVMANASKAYKTAGLSANQYMNAVNGFAASLNASLGENEWQSAHYADSIVTAMADNANKMGTSMDSIMVTWAGFAKQNYTMLDNLKLGYGGTKEEMERLLRDAEQYAGYIEGSLDVSNFADVADAIMIVQEHLGIAGTTALEAGTTISGAFASMQAAWTNLLIGMADGNADIGALIGDLVTTIVGDGTESNLGVLGNILPAVETALSGISQLIAGATPVFATIFSDVVAELVPTLITAGISLALAIGEGLVAAAPELYAAALGAIQTVLVEVFGVAEQDASGFVFSLGETLTGIFTSIQTVISAISGVVQTVFGAISSTLSSAGITWETVFSAISTAVSTFATWVQSAGQAVSGFVTWLQSGSAGATVLKGVIVAITAAIVAYQAATAVATTVSNALSAAQGVVNAVMAANPIGLVTAAIAALIAVIVLCIKNWDKIKQAAVDAWNGIKEIWTDVSTWVMDNVVTPILDTFSGLWDSFTEIGGNIIDGLKTGISNAWNSLTQWFSGLFGDLIGIAKSILGIASPSKVFKSIGRFSAEGFGIGFDDEFSSVKDDVEDAMSFDDVEIGANVTRSGAFGSAGGSIAEQNGQIVYLLSAILEATTGGNEDVVQAISESKMGVSGRDFGRLVKSYA